MIFIMLNFDTRFRDLAEKVTGAGGGYDGYSTVLFYFLPIILLNSLKKMK